MQEWTYLDVEFQAGDDCGGNLWWEVTRINSQSVPQREIDVPHFYHYLNQFGAQGWELVRLVRPIPPTWHEEYRTATFRQSSTGRLQYWEYIVLDVIQRPRHPNEWRVEWINERELDNPHNWNITLQHMREEGWELVQVPTFISPHLDWMEVVFKRMGQE